jgi:hypothetical protein
VHRNHAATRSAALNRPEILDRARAVRDPGSAGNYKGASLAALACVLIAMVTSWGGGNPCH